MQSVSNQFLDYVDGDIQPISWGVNISFPKNYDENVTFFILDTSVLNGIDILGTETDNPVQAWDKYDYRNYREETVALSVTRELEFPYSVASAIADFTLNNFDGYFTPNSGSPIDEYILPKRPVRLFMGMGGTGLQQFVGLTQGMPEIDEEDGLASWTAFDFLTQIYDMPIRETQAMYNVRTDQVLANIFEQFGLLPAQYNLSKGRNVINFLFFEKNQLTAGDVIRPLMQAEGGLLWLDEEGIIQFRSRLELPSESSYSFDNDSINSIETLGDSQIINKTIITTDIREVQPYTTVYSKNASDSRLDVVPANGTYVFKAELTDPLFTVEAPAFGQNADVSWFTAALPNGEAVNSGLSVQSTELKTNTYEVTIENTNSFDVNINQMSLWGRPAKRISVEPVIYENKDQDSVDKYEEQTLEISNNFIQDISAARSLALTILDEYSEYSDLIEVEVKPNPALQMGDIISIDYEQYQGDYRIIGMTNKLQDSAIIQILKLRKYTPREWFQLDVSVLNGSHVLAP